MPRDKLGAALESFQRRMAAAVPRRVRAHHAREQAEVRRLPVRQPRQDRVQVLPSGVQYRVIEAGSGPKPTAASTVQVHLRGSVSTGQEFANTYQSPGAKPAEFKLGEFPLKGLQNALMMMPSGSRWEVFLPPDQAYGNDPRSPLGPGQAVVFDVKLVSVK